MNDDYCEDWYEEEDYSAQFPRAAEETGWGIEETMYTSSLDKSKLTPEQIANAERIAAEIERESRSKVKSTNMGGVGGFMPPPAQTYAESQTSNFMQQQKKTLPPKPPKQPQPQQTPEHQQFANECKVVKWLQEEMNRVIALIGTVGNPRPEQAARLLVEYTTSVTTMIPYSPPEVKSAVVASFAKCNWDVIRRKPTPGMPPPSGKTLCDLIFELGTYFCKRTNQPGPPPGFVEKKLAEHRAKQQKLHPPRQQTIPNVGGPRPHKGKGKGGGKGYNNNGKGYNNGKGKGRRNEGKGGKGRPRN